MLTFFGKIRRRWQDRRAARRFGQIDAGERGQMARELGVGASALAGAQMFGLGGGLLGVPVAATAMALIDLYKRRYEISDATIQAAERDAKKELDDVSPPEDPPGRTKPAGDAARDASKTPPRTGGSSAVGS